MSLPPKLRAALAFVAFLAMSVADRLGHKDNAIHLTLLRDTNYVVCAFVAGTLAGDTALGAIARFFLGLGLSGGSLLERSRESSLLVTILTMQLLRFVTD